MKTAKITPETWSQALINEVRDIGIVGLKNLVFIRSVDNGQWVPEKLFGIFV